MKKKNHQMNPNILLTRKKLIQVILVPKITLQPKQPINNIHLLISREPNSNYKKGRDLRHIPHGTRAS